MVELLRRAGARGGVFSVRDADQCGYGRAQRRALLASGAWVELRRGAYAERQVAAFCRADPLRWHCLITAAALAVRPTAVASQRSAAALHALDLLRPLPGRPTVTERPRPGYGGTRRRDLRVMTASLPPDHVTDVFGLPATTAPRTTVDLLRKLPFRQGVVLADSALRNGATTSQLLDVHRECAGWPGSVQARAAIGFADGRSESALESVGRVVMWEQQLPRPELQQWVGESSAEFRVDYLFTSERTVGEADGAVKYRRRKDLVSEKRREDRLRDLGFEVVRFDDADVAGDGAAMADRFRRAFVRARPGIGQIFSPPPWASRGRRWSFSEWPAELADVPWWLRDPADLELWADGEGWPQGSVISRL